MHTKNADSAHNVHIMYMWYIQLLILLRLRVNCVPCAATAKPTQRSLGLCDVAGDLAAELAAGRGVAAGRPSWAEAGSGRMAAPAIAQEAASGRRDGQALRPDGV